MHKKLRREAEYLAGKPIRIRWWVLLLYMIPPTGIAGFLFGNFIINGAIPFEGLRAWEILLTLGLLCYPTVLAAMRTRQMIVIEKNGLFVRDYFGRTYNIPYFAIRSYAILKNYGEGVVIHAHGKKHYFRSDLAGYTYLRDEIKRKVGEEKEVEG